MVIINEWLISVPAGRFVADATLPLRFRTEQKLPRGVR